MVRQPAKRPKTLLLPFVIILVRCSVYLPCHFGLSLFSILKKKKIWSTVAYMVPCHNYCFNTITFHNLIIFEEHQIQHDGFAIVSIATI